TPSVAFHKNIANNPHSGNIVGAIHELPLHRTFGHYHIGSTDVLVCGKRIAINCQNLPKVSNLRKVFLFLSV
ncbi:MAG TPA: hypothetical protein PL149_09035, partial [Candidatus Kapabacteria bacterium]|nr:hypothetical protein [Candidatus Kapabacteria bacterium]